MCSKRGTSSSSSCACRDTPCPSISFPAMFYLLFGVLFGGRSLGGASLTTYLLATYGAFGVIGAALFGFGVGVAIERGQGWMMLKRASPMPPMAFFVAKLFMCAMFALTIFSVWRCWASASAACGCRRSPGLRLGATLVARRAAVLRHRPRARLPARAELRGADREPALPADVVPLGPVDSVSKRCPERSRQSRPSCRRITSRSWRSARSDSGPVSRRGGTSSRSPGSPASDSPSRSTDIDETRIGLGDSFVRHGNRAWCGVPGCLGARRARVQECQVRRAGCERCRVRWRGYAAAPSHPCTLAPLAPSPLRTSST